jgi:hypothetical protein
MPIAEPRVARGSAAVLAGSELLFALVAIELASSLCDFAQTSPAIGV